MISHSRWVVPCSLLALSLAQVEPSLAEEPYDRCVDVLLARNVQVFKSESYLRLIWSKAITQSNYERIKQDLVASVPGYFTGSWDNDQAKLNSLNVTENLDITQEEAVFALSSLALPDAATQWRGCMEATSDAPVLYARLIGPSNGDQFQVVFRWKPRAGTADKLRVSKQVVRGATLATFDIPSSLRYGEVTAFVDRAEGNPVIRGAVEGTDGVKNYSARIFLPRRIDPPVCPPEQLADVRRAELEILGVDDLLKVRLHEVDLTGYIGFGGTGRVNLLPYLRKDNNNELSFEISNATGPCQVDALLKLNECTPVSLRYSGCPAYGSINPRYPIPLKAGGGREVPAPQ